ncbi:universal stress protein [Desulfococcaceae bacterium HSG8]|nr:universal stress protein [Desulfococcaceae bacterium HSG8]
MKVQIQNIICATDFSEFSRKVMNCGVGLAMKFNARLLVFHAVCFPRDQIYGTVSSERSKEHEKMTLRAHEKIRELMGEYSLNWEPVVTFGEPVEEVDRIAREQGADLVVAASHELTGWKRLLLGTVVERLARTLSCPLLVVRSVEESDILPREEKTAALEFRRIVAGCDLTSTPALRYAADLAQEFHAELHLLHTVESPVDEELMDSAQASYGEIQQRMQDRLHQQLTELVPPEAAENCELKTRLLPGIPGEKLSSYAAENHADLIVVGVRPRSVLKKILIGSTTEAVLRNAPCPVMVVP